MAAHYRPLYQTTYYLVKCYERIPRDYHRSICHHIYGVHPEERIFTLKAANAIKKVEIKSGFFVAIICVVETTFKVS